MFENSPLFQNAAKHIQEAARREFQRTTVGRLAQEAVRVQREASRGPERLQSGLQSYVKHGMDDALRSLKGSTFGELSRDIQRYSREGPTRLLIQQFLADLGPAGTLINALIGPGTKLAGELEIMAGVLRSFGFDVTMPGPGARSSGPSSVAAARKMLEEAGYTVYGPGEQPKQPPLEAGEHRPLVTGLMDLVDEYRGRVPADHPMLTGDMVMTPASTNVHSVGYDVDQTMLYVRFKGYVRGEQARKKHLGRGGLYEAARRQGPGPLYRYWPVLPEEFLDLMKTQFGGMGTGPGEWLWDNVRVRGTWGQHQKNYELVGITQNYVPRQAITRRNPATGRQEEWFVRRRVKTPKGDYLVSPLKTEQAGPVPFGQLDRGAPDSANPDRPFQP